MFAEVRKVGKDDILSEVPQQLRKMSWGSFPSRQSNERSMQVRHPNRAASAERSIDFGRPVQRFMRR